VKYSFNSGLKTAAISNLLARSLVVSLGGTLAVLLVAVGGCVASGYGGDGNYDGGVVGYGGVDVYDGPGYDYGGWGWGRGYRVGPPPRGGFDRGHPDHGGPPQRAYRSAPSGHSMPSIPSGPRGGGFGRGHSGGGGHRP
jgi:hypothetical protein